MLKDFVCDSEMIIAIVGMCGSGKSESANYFSSKGLPVVRFGDATEIEVKKRGLELNPANEKIVRESLRKNLGMDAFAKVNESRIKDSLKKTKHVIIDGLYSWEEYLYLAKVFDEQLILLHICASPKTRQNRLAARKIRPLTPDETKLRDIAEIENSKKGGPIAIANYTIVNEGTLKELFVDLGKFYVSVIEH